MAMTGLGDPSGDSACGTEEVRSISVLKSYFI